MDPFVSYEDNDEYSQKSSVLYYTWLERLARTKHYGLLVPSVSFEKNEVLRILPRATVITIVNYAHNTFIVEVTGQYEISLSL